MSVLRVLIVDDQQSFRDVARELLRARGHVVVAEAQSGRTALDAAARFAPDAVLLDVRLQGESGLVVARALMDAHPDLLVLLTSSDDSGMRPERVRECGARGFVLKQRLPRVDLDHLWHN
jgi:DNA-binding NarL/FixJ family response regulator